MEALANLITDTIAGIQQTQFKEIASKLSNFYVDYEMNPSHENLNKGVTTAYEIFYSIDEINVPSPEEFINLFQKSACEEIKKLYDADYNIFGEITAIDNEEFSHDNTIHLDFRIPNICHLLAGMDNRMCFLKHENKYNEYKQIFNLAVDTKDAADAEILDQIHEHVFQNLRELHEIVNGYLKVLED